MFRSSNYNEYMLSTISAANNPALLASVVMDIKNEEIFDMSTAPPSYLSAMFDVFMRHEDLEVVVYYPKWRWSKAYGYFIASKPKTIHVNGYKFLGLSLAQRVALLFHEAGHAMDTNDRKYSYNHGSNNPIGKQNTFQYSLNRYVYDYYGYTKPPVKYKKPWYKRLWNWLF